MRRCNTTILMVLIATVKCLKSDSLRVHVPPLRDQVSLRVIFGAVRLVSDRMQVSVFLF